METALLDPYTNAETKKTPVLYKNEEASSKSRGK